MATAAPAVIGTGHRRAGDGQVGVTDRLDLLEAVPVGHLVEAAEEGIEGTRELPPESIARPDAVDPTASTNTTLTSSYACAIRSPCEALSCSIDRLRQDVQQEAVRPQALLVQLALADVQGSRVNRSIR